MSRGPRQVAVPDLVELPEAEALTALADAELVPGAVSEAYSETIAAGSVISSDPAADAELAPGSAVDYVRSLGPERVAVPDLVELPEAEALTALADAELVPGAVSEAYSETIAAGSVISSDPAPGTTVDVNSSVDYVVSLGVEQVAVPDLSGAAADAGAKLVDAGLLTGAVSEAFSDTVSAGDVISQTPAADAEVAIGSAVDYVVSLGVEQVAVPDVRERSEADATAAIEAVGLTVGAVEQRTNATIPAGAAVRTEPAAGTEIDKGSSVVLFMSRGPRQVAVPDLVELPEAEALTALADAELVPGAVSEAYSETIAAGSVISSDPAPGTTVDVNSSVDYVVSLGVERVAVPDLSGAAADAGAKLVDAGLLTGAVTEAFSDTVSAGDVISQTPAADAEVAIGSAVDYVVSLGVEQVAVPDVRERSEADATAAIEAVGLTVGAVEQRTNATIPAGAAVRTEPAAGTEIDKGSSVVLFMSRGPRQVAVPDLVELPEAEALTALADAELVPGAVSEAYSETIAAGSVISSDPAPGTTVDVNSSVDYVVSLGVTPNAIVPDVRDLPRADAIAEIETAELVVGETIEQSHEKIFAGNAIKTDPAAGSESPVRLISHALRLDRLRHAHHPRGEEHPGRRCPSRARGPGPGGRAPAAHQQQRRRRRRGQDRPRRRVRGGGRLRGRAHRLRGPKQVVVPDVVGSSRPDARAAIEAAKLTSARRGPSRTPRPRARSSPGPGRWHRGRHRAAPWPNRQLRPAHGDHPRGEGHPGRRCPGRARGRGLVVEHPAAHQQQRRRRRRGQDRPRRRVERWRPAPRSCSPSARGPKQVVVPDVVGSSRPDARPPSKPPSSAVGAVEVVDDAAPASTVLTQDPAAGIEVPQGSAVA